MQRHLERRLPITRISPDLWRDRSRGDVIQWNEVVERYEHHVPPSARRTIETPPELMDFLSQFKVHLIEAQRLFALGGEHSETPQVSTVMRFAADLARRLSIASAQNSRTSVQLDRSFPRRILQLEELPEATDEVIRKRYDAQNTLRRRLAEIAVLDAEPDFPLPARALEDWQRHVLSTYLDDTDQKLSTFQWLLDRVGLLREAVTSRFLFKRIVIHREKGFLFVTDQGLEIDADLLSTGEQHELVLTYDLLFNVEPETLVLIDEPEISLHVAWQQEFLDDISQIADLVGLRFIVATHSPQIIHKWWSRTVPLLSDM